MGFGRVLSCFGCCCPLSRLPRRGGTRGGASSSFHPWQPDEARGGHRQQGKQLRQPGKERLPLPPAPRIPSPWEGSGVGVPTLQPCPWEALGATEPGHIPPASPCPGEPASGGSLGGQRVGGHGASSPGERPPSSCTGTEGPRRGRVPASTLCRGQGDGQGRRRAAGAKRGPGRIPAQSAEESAQHSLSAERCRLRRRHGWRDQLRGAYGCFGAPEPLLAPAPAQPLSWRVPPLSWRVPPLSWRVPAVGGSPHHLGGAKVDVSVINLAGTGSTTPAPAACMVPAPAPEPTGTQGPPPRWSIPKTDPALGGRRVPLAAGASPRQTQAWGDAGSPSLLEHPQDRPRLGGTQGPPPCWSIPKTDPALGGHRVPLAAGAPPPASPSPAAWEGPPTMMGLPTTPPRLPYPAHHAAQHGPTHNPKPPHDHHSQWVGVTPERGDAPPTPPRLAPRSRPRTCGSSPSPPCGSCSGCTACGSSRSGFPASRP